MSGVYSTSRVLWLQQNCNCYCSREMNDINSNTKLLKAEEEMDELEIQLKGATGRKEIKQNLQKTATNDEYLVAFNKECQSQPIGKNN